MPLALPALFVERLSSSTVLLSVGDSAIGPAAPAPPVSGPPLAWLDLGFRRGLPGFCLCLRRPNSPDACLTAYQALPELRGSSRRAALPILLWLPSVSMPLAEPSFLLL